MERRRGFWLAKPIPRKLIIDYLFSFCTNIFYIFYFCGGRHYWKLSLSEVEANRLLFMPRQLLPRNCLDSHGTLPILFKNWPMLQWSLPVPAANNLSGSRLHFWMIPEFGWGFLINIGADYRHLQTSPPFLVERQNTCETKRLAQSNLGQA